MPTICAEATRAPARRAVRWALWGGCVVMMVGPMACSDPPPEQPEQLEPEASECARDEQSESAQAAALPEGGGEGYVCPVQDQDWWTYSMPSDHRVLQVGLQLSAPLSPVEPSYAVWSSEGGEPAELLASPQATKIGEQLQDVHCVPAGELLVRIHDSGDDAQDTRHTYSLQISSSPDPDDQEPNDALEEAAPLEGGQRTEGYVACRGDEDWFEITVPEGNLVRVRLESERAGYQPALELYNEAGDLLVDASNPRGQLEATDIDRFEVLQGAGTYAIKIHDDDDEQADPQTPYALTVEYVADEDPNEPNNHPRDATPIQTMAQGCDQASQEFTFSGTIGSPNDQDWFRLPLDQGCQGALLDASVELDTSGLSQDARWEIQDDLQIALAMVRPSAESPCEQDTSCNTLQKACSEPNDCAGFFETCLPDGLCAGASVCLPEGTCGANQVLRRYECPPQVPECQPGSGGAPPPMRAELSAPLFSEDVIYLRVADFQADAGAPGRTYTLRVRVRPSTDVEPSNLFTNELPRDGLSSIPHRPFARQVTVHDCTDGMDCCDGSTWVEGTIGYQNDLGLVSLRAPLPGRRLHDAAALRDRAGAGRHPAQPVPGLPAVVYGHERGRSARARGAAGALGGVGWADDGRSLLLCLPGPRRSRRAALLVLHRRPRRLRALRERPGRSAHPRLARVGRRAALPVLRREDRRRVRRAHLQDL